MATQARKRVRVPDYEYNSDVARRAAKRIKTEQSALRDVQIKQDPTHNIKTEVKIEVRILI